MLLQYFDCIKTLEIFLTYFCNILCYVLGEVLKSDPKCFYNEKTSIWISKIFIFSISNSLFD